jgi:hypothetical protein
MIGAKGFRAREAAANYKRRDRRLVSDEVRAARTAQLPGVSFHGSAEVTDDLAAKAAAEAAAKEAAEAAEKAAAEAAEKEAADTTEQAGDDAGDQAGEEAAADKPAKTRKKK